MVWWCLLLSFKQGPHLAIDDDDHDNDDGIGDIDGSADHTESFSDLSMDQIFAL